MSRLFLIFAIFCLHTTVVAEDSDQDGFLIQNVRIIDGTGSESFNGAVRVQGQHIVASGKLEPQENERVIDGKGQVLAPGFIDTHSHMAGDIEEERGALAAVSQGITTSIGGQDGSSPLPLSDYFDRLEHQPAALNVAYFSGHNTVRRKVMGDNIRRPANDAETEAMTALLETDMKAGALGLASGLEYEPGIWSETSEVITLAKVAAEYQGRYISHVRSEDRWFLEAIDEIIEIGRAAKIPVQISHLKLAMKNLWGRAEEVLAKLDAARSEGIDITADMYPYEYWQSNIMVLVPSRNLDARSEFEVALAEIAPPEGLWFTRFEPQPAYEGLKLTEIAELRELDPVTTLMQLARESIEFDGNPQGPGHLPEDTGPLCAGAGRIEPGGGGSQDVRASGQSYGHSIPWPDQTRTGGRSRTIRPGNSHRPRHAYSTSFDLRGHHNRLG
jgi:N-acyl-D-amino-acid deacylase